MLRHKLSGVGAAMITPFTADGRVDYKALARMIDYVIEGGGPVEKAAQQELF